jgi:hypothetical protein
VITQPSNEDFDVLRSNNESLIDEENETKESQRMAEAIAEKAVLDTFSLPFGTLHYASADGRNPTRGCHQDFALVQLSATRFPVPPPNVVSLYHLPVAEM